MNIKRALSDFLDKRLFGGKALIIYGPRQAGKTTAIHDYLSQSAYSKEVAEFDGDITADREMLADVSVEKMRILLGNKKILFIDEAQKIPSIGIILKRIFDHLPEVQIIASGSSSVELAEKTEEPLTGRKFEFTLLPLSFAELAATSSPLDEGRLCETRLLFGSYPDVVTHPGDEIDRIGAIGKGYLYKDILQFGEIRRPELIDKLLRALALQIGQEVSLSELANTIGSNPKTVANYMDILAKAFIVFRLPSYARNLRSELKKSQKIYFYDCGIRNYVIGDWRPLDARGPAEIGHLWENYLMAERAKWRLRNSPQIRAFFWRTAQGQEIDLIEENSTALNAYEFKWNAQIAPKYLCKTFTNAYPEAVTQSISPENAYTFLL